MNTISAPKKQNVPHILLVEDNRADAELIKAQVKHVWADAVVTVVDSLSKAYEVYSSTKLDLFLLDLNLPDGFGPRSVEEVMAFSRAVPIVVITGMGSQMTIAEATKYGARDVVFKDKIMTDEFKDVLARACRPS